MLHVMYFALSHGNASCQSNNAKIVRYALGRVNIANALRNAINWGGIGGSCPEVSPGSWSPGLDFWGLNHAPEAKSYLNLPHKAAHW